MPRNIHAKSVHLRLATIHSWSRRPVTSAATRERERHRAADEARVEARRVDDHPVVLEQRVEALAVGARAGDARRERVRREGHEHAEEEDDRHQRRDDVRLKLEVPLAEPLDARADVDAEEEQPPEERAVLPAPQRGEEVVQRHRPVGVVGDVADAEVVGDERVGEAERRRCRPARPCRRRRSAPPGASAAGRSRRPRARRRTCSWRRPWPRGAGCVPNAGNVLPKTWSRLVMGRPVRRWGALGARSLAAAGV